MMRTSTLRTILGAFVGVSFLGVGRPSLETTPYVPCRRPSRKRRHRRALRVAQGRRRAQTRRLAWKRRERGQRRGGCR